MLDKLNQKLAEIRQGKAKATETIEAVDKQIANLKGQRERAIANLNAFIGAEETVLQLIEEVNKTDRAQEVRPDENIQA